MQRMPWTRIQKMLSERLAKSLRGRLAIHQARYRHSREELGRIWVEIDQVEVASFTTTSAVRRRRELTDELMDVNNSWGSTTAYHHADQDALALMNAAGEQSDYAAWGDLEAYLSLPIEEALTSTNPLIRALAMVDRRIGKRRLQALRISKRDHPLVFSLYSLRCEAEGIVPRG